MKLYIPLLLTIITFASVAVAQDKKDKIEIGVQSTSLTLFHPDFSFDETQAGVGGRVTYNFNRSIAAEAEINFFPQKHFIVNGDGSAIQGQFGVKAGKRFEKFGLFGKVRPGFLSVNNVARFLPPPGSQGGTFDIDIERHTFFTIDAGGVLELYPSKRFVVRFDAGDTIVRHPESFTPVIVPGPLTQLIRPAKFNHNFQFTAGVAFRLGDFPEDGSNTSTSGSGQGGTKRFEVGAQFTSIIVRPLRTVQSAIVLPEHTEPGFGGRFTFNLTDSVAFEAEGNYFTRVQGDLRGGHMFQGQFGGKVGKRFDKWGVFGKARPGFVGFTRVFEFPGAQVPEPIHFVRKHYPSLDVGGVVEFYIWPRWMARFDAGDTIIRYGEISIDGFPFGSVIIQRREVQHNLQLSSGIAFRF